MKLIELDSHPVIEAFRNGAKDLKNVDHKIFHLLLPPEYNLGEFQNPLLYLFVEDEANPGTFVQYENPEYVLKKCDDPRYLSTFSGFESSVRVELLQTTPCATTGGFSFEMHEIDTNPFQPSPIPPLCNEIHEAYSSPDTAMSFLLTRVRSSALPDLISSIKRDAYLTSISPINKDDIVSYLQKSLDEVCNIVFEVKPFHFIPTVFKMYTNFIIFYAISGIFHTQLLKAYHDSMTTENLAAQKAVRRASKSVGDPAKLDAAAQNLRSLPHMASVADGIRMIEIFFNGVMESLPKKKEAAADDILPAICDGISRCTAISSHIVSSFQYLADIWPQEGLDEKKTYMIVTCAIAASHFSCPYDAHVDLPIPKLHTIEVDKQTEDTIQMLEDLLDTV